MNYRSISDMNDAIMRNLHRLPRDIDLVVGVPRSGVLAATLVSLTANIPMTDLDSFLAGRIYTSGITKRRAALDRQAAEMRRILVIDDSVSGGNAMRDARDKIEAAGIKGNFVFAAVFGLLPQHEETDIVFEVVPHPRMFQWNFMHHIFLEQCCVDIDGVLCLDPTEEENDDGPAYEKFLGEARPLLGPTRKIGWLVTSRLEKYRKLTEAWLARHEIKYDQLIMLDLPSKAERQRLGAHGSFKAEFYRKSNAILFIESEHQQALKIAKLSGKPVLCVETNIVSFPDALSLPALEQRARNLPARLRETNSPEGRKKVAKAAARALLGERGYEMLKSRVKRTA
ncbi:MULTISPECIES: phosphoribosyltransferase [unclassified Mesorhizobium]|uniref:phosphoribosyltransferase n=1 Tax=unclassified Mesorhizobium TaxID=325217 RepID=UPI000BAF53C3|nr:MULTISPECIES: phosphoribosyltransferase [unclassified Mesorhizobium]TGT60847.1 phosphoribosyltransferase [Mesorhizobium sp. M00.F.Ca.ET.170.01.1.1]AZO10052.1 phosphoribosyltransferase [Mesorhizobium sp. M3A.F.Ca.ET.080.04.2.1]PBB86510.1 phosphoribosyltransferase [Mesorhizobium sp. WSM3876]RWB75738.1 MAG: phosphoribosyltransferase [Mesorhizobium sp.]RWB91490.1 MAG: phosphoribosyltransferase [Mesorhizobium sp.]